MSGSDPSLTDVGPAIPPPNWCAPGAQPRLEALLERSGSVDVAWWERKVSADVWIEADDRVIDGRVMRSAPRIRYFDAPEAGLTARHAHDLAAGLVAAADIVTCAALEAEQRR